MKKTNRLIPFYYYRENDPPAEVSIVLEALEYPVCFLRIINDTNARISVKISFDIEDDDVHDLIPSYQNLELKGGYTGVENYHILPLGTFLTLTPDIDDQEEVVGALAVAAYTWMREA
jgi:hypothetical protein